MPLQARSRISLCRPSAGPVERWGLIRKLRVTTPTSQDPSLKISRTIASLPSNSETNASRVKCTSRTSPSVPNGIGNRSHGTALSRRSNPPHVPEDALPVGSTTQHHARRCALLHPSFTMILRQPESPLEQKGCSSKKTAVPFELSPANSIRGREIKVGKLHRAGWAILPSEYERTASRPVQCHHRCNAAKPTTFIFSSSTRSHV